MKKVRTDRYVRARKIFDIYIRHLKFGNFKPKIVVSEPKTLLVGSFKEIRLDSQFSFSQFRPRIRLQ